MDIESLRAKYFPFTLPKGYVVHPSTKDEVYAFQKLTFDEIFGKRDATQYFRVPEPRFAAAREMSNLYQKLHHEWFLFKTKAGEPVGWFMGEAEDFQTFYMRNTGILPEHQNQGIYTSFAAQLTKYIGEIGYERISSQHKVTNQKILISKLRMGFIICNLELTENWGPMVKLVKLLPKDRQDAFIKAFGDPGHGEFFKAE